MPAAKPKSVHVIEASLGTMVNQGREAQVIRGAIEPDFFDSFVVPPYQREAMLHHKHTELVECLRPNGRGVPDDILLCVRGSKVTPLHSGTFLVPGPLYLLDGHQRHEACMALLRDKEKCQKLGVKIILGTDEDEEIATFFQVNRLQTPVSTNVLLRNNFNSAAVVALMDLEKQAHEEQRLFPHILRDQTTKAKSKPLELNNRTYFEVAVILHGYGPQSKIEELTVALDEITERYGTAVLIANVRTFFEIVAECFGGKEELMYRAYLLRSLAMLFRDYQDFWDKSNTRVLVKAPDKRKLVNIRKKALEDEIATSSHPAILNFLIRQVEKSGRATLKHREA